RSDAQSDDRAAGPRDAAPDAGSPSDFDAAKILKAAPQPMLCFDAAGRCLWINDAAAQLSGRDAAAPVGTDRTQLVWPADRPRLSLALGRQQMRSLDTSITRAHLLGEDGGERPVALRILRVVMPEARDLFMAIVLDIDHLETEVEGLLPVAERPSTRAI